ncbi:MAG: TRAP transporter small permease subunit [Proteobacteria bacterium]|nr:TRAP transporter small permease subunit [Pseudomonadota bacterium]
MAGHGARPGAESPAGPVRAGFEAALRRLVEGFALAGGAALLLVTLVTAASVIGGAVFDAPILGDKEVVEVGGAVAVFAFMPYCQMRGAQVVVDVFTARAPARLKAALDAAASLAFAAVVALLSWRLAAGGWESYARGDFSMFLRIPAWWGYLAAVVSSALWTLVCLWAAIGRLRAAGAGRIGRGTGR